MPPRILKIDVEGAEYGVLRGAIALLSDHSPSIFLATHGNKVQRECVGFLSAIGYRVEPVAGTVSGQAGELFAYQ